jgi:hypothetical protein
MPNQMGNSRRGPDDLDRALDNLVDDEQIEDERDVRYASPPDGGDRVLGEGEEVGPWTDEDPDDDALDADAEEDEGDDGGGFQMPPPK